MKRSGTVRALYLLALLQLVGGPAILCGIILLAKLTATHEITQGGGAGLHAVVGSQELAALVHDLLPLPEAPVGHSEPLPPGKTKNSVAKLLLAGETLPPPFTFLNRALESPALRLGLIPQRAHAPPVPPPRLA